jgi:hypothetical protein
LNLARIVRLAKNASMMTSSSRIEITVAIAAPAMPVGAKEEIDFEVVDAHAFAAKFPQFVTITVKRAEVIAALKKSYAAKGKLPEVAGLRVFQNLRVRTR